MERCTLISILLLTVMKIGGSTLNFQANPPDIAPGLTSTLTVNCSYDVQKSTSMAALISLIISSRNVTSTSGKFRELASINSYTGHQTNFQSNASISSSGKIKVLGQSFLLVEFSNPSTNEIGDYECIADGVDSTGHPITATASVHVTGSKPAADEIISRVKLLEEQTHQRKIEISSVDKNLRLDFGQAMTYLESSVKTMVDNLNASFGDSDKTCTTQFQSDFKTMSSRIDAVNASLVDDKNILTSHIKNQLTILDTKIDTNTKALNESTRTELQYLLNTVQSLQQQVATSTSVIQNLEQKLNHTEQSVIALEKKQNAFDLRLNKTETAIFETPFVYHNSKYLLSRSDFKDVSVAMATCEIFGGYLAEIDDVNEYNVIVSFLKTFSSQAYFGFIISGTDEAREGHWVYQRSQRPLTFTKWGQGQPTNVQKANCLAIYSAYNYVMADETCFNHGSNFPFLCEVPL